jgi:hypothetical protein
LGDHNAGKNGQLHGLPLIRSPYPTEYGLSAALFSLINSPLSGFFLTQEMHAIIGEQPECVKARLAEPQGKCISRLEIEENLYN